MSDTMFTVSAWGTLTLELKWTMMVRAANKNEAKRIACESRGALVGDVEIMNEIKVEVWHL